MFEALGWRLRLSLGVAGTQLLCLVLLLLLLMAPAKAQADADAASAESVHEARCAVNTVYLGVCALGRTIVPTSIIEAHLRRLDPDYSAKGATVDAVATCLRELGVLAQPSWKTLHEIRKSHNPTIVLVSRKTGGPGHYILFYTDATEQLIGVDAPNRPVPLPAVVDRQFPVIELHADLDGGWDYETLALLAGVLLVSLALTVGTARGIQRLRTRLAAGRRAPS